MKKFVLFMLLCIVLVFSLARSSESKLKSYYSGDAISFDGHLYVGSTNSDSLEIFKLNNRSLEALAKIRPIDERFCTYGQFYDLKFSIEDSHLFVYTISEYTLYKYEILPNNQVVLINSVKNTYWEWYSRVDKFGADLVTISSNGINIWNKDMQVINSYNLVDSGSPYNLRSSDNENILDVSGNYLKLYSRSQRVNILNIPVNYKKNTGNHQTYRDVTGNIFIVDDYFLKKFDSNGNLLASFKHAPYQGYDVSTSGVNDYIYFTNGAGLVKLDKNTLKEITYRWTGNLGAPAGWATGLKVVDVNGDDKVAIFNSSNILILDKNLLKITSIEAGEESSKIESLENLFLNLDHNFAAAGDSITVSGGGYAPNEKLNINFGGVNSKSQADYQGRFSQTLTVPSSALPAVDIKVVGDSSKLSYSISFKIIK